MHGVFMCIYIYTWLFPEIGVPPKSSIFMGFAIKNQKRTGYPVPPFKSKLSWWVSKIQPRSKAQLSWTCPTQPEHWEKTLRAAAEVRPVGDGWPTQMWLSVGFVREWSCWFESKKQNWGGSPCMKYIQIWNKNRRDEPWIQMFQLCWCENQGGVFSCPHFSAHFVVLDR